MMASQHYLGNALQCGLTHVLEKNNAYRQVTVDSNRGCWACALRYLCGGYCRAWSVSDDPNAPLPDCTALRLRTVNILQAALNVLDISTENWQVADLPGLE